MLDLNDLRYFVRIVECGGLTAAGRNLNEPKSTVSHRLQQLETSLGVRLLNRTSRSQSLTDSGNLFYHHARGVGWTRHAPHVEARVIRQPGH
jgi:DNA-binding transcriptional LysR family regulator